MALPSTETYAIKLEAGAVYESTGGYPTNRVYHRYERTPDLVGAPATSAWSTVASVLVTRPTTYSQYTDYLPAGSGRKHYRVRQTGFLPFQASAYTGTVSAKPSVVYEE